MTLDKLIRFVRPEAQFSYVGEPTNADEYAAQVTFDNVANPPTWDELQAVKPEVEKQDQLELMTRARANAYRAESDPLYFGWQRGENTEQAWLDKVAEIRARYPYPA